MIQRRAYLPRRGIGSLIRSFGTCSAGLRPCTPEECVSHFRVSFGVVARSTGHSAAKRAAYQMCAEMAAPGTGEVFDFSHKAHQHRGTEILAPAGAPAWTRDPAELWARAAASERRGDAQEARLIEVSIPREVPDQFHGAFVRHALQPLADAGMVVQVDLHRERALDGSWNDHCHGMATMRRLDEATETGFSAKKERSWNDQFADFVTKPRPDGSRKPAKSAVQDMRAAVAGRMNQFCREHGIDYVADARSLKAQGIEREAEPQVPHWKFEAAREGRPQAEIIDLAAFRDAYREAEAAAATVAALEQAPGTGVDKDLVVTLAGDPPETAPAPTAEAAAPGAAVADPGEPVVGAAPNAPAEAPTATPADAPARGTSGGSAPSAGAAQTDDTPDDVEFVEPLDPRRKGDVKRFLKQAGRLLQKQAQKAAAQAPGRSSTGGKQDGKWLEDLIRSWLDALEEVARHAEREQRPLSYGQAREQARAIRAIRAERAGRAPVDARPDPRGAGRHGAGPEHSARARPQGHDRRRVRDPEERRDGGGPARPPRVARRAGARRGDAARPDPRALGADRGEPDPHRAAAGRARIENRRASRSLAASAASRSEHLAHLTAALRRAPTSASLAHDAIQADRKRVLAVLATAPHPDPKSRATDHVASELRDQVHERQTRAEREADAAARRAEKARRGLRWHDRILPTQRAREAHQAGAEAMQLELDAELGREAIREDLHAADRRAPIVAQGRRDRQEQWEQRPEVLDAHRRGQANAVIETRIRGGDRELEARVASGDLDGAQEQVLEDERRRQDEFRHQREEKLRREHEERMRGYEPGRGRGLVPGGRAPAPSAGPRR